MNEKIEEGMPPVVTVINLRGLENQSRFSIRVRPRVFICACVRVCVCFHIYIKIRRLGRIYYGYVSETSCVARPPYSITCWPRAVEYSNTSPFDLKDSVRRRNNNTTKGHGSKNDHTDEGVYLVFMLSALVRPYSFSLGAGTSENSSFTDETTVSVTLYYNDITTVAVVAY